MKKLLLITSIVILLVAFGVWSPWLEWNISLSSIFGLDQKESKSGIQLNSLVGEINLFLDNELIGSTDPGSGTLIISDISPGNHELKLTRNSQQENVYTEIIRNIKFEEGVDVIVSFDLGPSKEFSEGHIFYAEKSFNSDSSKLNIISSPDSSKVYIDGIFRGETPLSNVELSLSSQHTIKLEKTGYETIEFPILPSSQDERDKLNGFSLNLETNLFLLPIVINQLN